MLLLIDTFSINKGRGYENPSLEIIVTERCSTGGCPLEEACEHCYLNQSVISAAISYIISVYCEDYAGYFTVILSFLAFHLCSAYFIYLVSCRFAYISQKSKYHDLLDDAVRDLFLKGISEEYLEILNLMESGEISHKPFS
jgi:hypothetical protein